MAQARKFGWFAGVFTPSILTILGVIMYLRLPSIVGQAGLWTTIGIITVAHVISVCTGLSVASIATDKRVEAGGTYYMISRSLGLPIGGTLGLALFVGLSFSVSLYIIGFSESFLGYIGADVTKNTIRTAGTLTLIAVTVVTFLSTELALKAQFYIMLAIGLSLLSIVTGSHDLAPAAVTTTTSLAQGASFIVLFGIFFPAVTGFEAGVSMSGDLKDPKKAIPVGTILAILVGLVVYLLLAAFFARTVSSDALRNDPNILLNISRFPALVVAGIWGATISSALGSILGAPRILQATATDGIAPRFFGKGFGPSNEPRNALLVTFVIAEVGILIGELDVIARVVSMFFITTYGFLNLSCAIERWASPDFRPEFKVPSAVSLIGATACFVVMVQLDLIAMFGATVVLGTLYLLLQRRQLTLASGDTWEGFWSSVSRVALSRLSRRQGHQRNWRPNVLLFAGETAGREYLRTLGEWLAYQRGMVSNVELIPSKGSSGRMGSKALEEPEDRTGFFASQVECEDIYDGMVNVARLHGFAGIRPNTVLLGWSGPGEHPTAYHSALASMADLDLNLLVLAYDQRAGYGEFETVDVWLEGGGRNAGLALALVGFLATADRWRRAEVRFLKWYQGESAFAGAVHDAIQHLLQDRRISAKVQVVQAAPGEDFATAVHRESGATDLTLIGVPGAASLASDEFVRETSRIVEAIGTVLLLRGSDSFEDLDLGEFASEAHVEVPLEGSSEAPIDWTSLTGDGAVGAELGSLHLALRAVAESLDAEMAVAEGLAADLLEETAATVENTFGSLDDSLDLAERTRSARAVDRATARLLYRSTEIQSEAGGSRLESQARALTTAVGLAARRIENLPASLPLRLKTGDGKRDIRLRASFEALVLPGLLTQLEDVVRRFDRVEEARLNGAARLQAGALDALDRLANDLERNGSDPDATLQSERARVSALATRLAEEMDGTRASDRQATRQLGTSVLTDWASALSRSQSSAATLRARRPDKNSAIGRLREPGAAWSGHQSARVAEAVLQARLRAARHRLRIVLERALLDARVEVEATLRGLEAADEALTERLEGTGDGAGHLPDVPNTLEGDAFLRTLAGELRSALVDLPQEWTAPAPSAEDAGDPLEPLETVDITPRATVDQLLQAKLLTPLEPALLAVGTASRRAHETAADVRRLVRFAATDDSDAVDGRGGRPLQAVLASGLERIRRARKGVEESLAAALGAAEDGLKTVESHMIASAVGSGEPLSGAAAGTGRSRWSRRLSGAAAGARAGLNRRLAGVWYRRSRGVLLSERLRAGERAEGTPLGRLATLVEGHSPDPDLLDRLPFFYRQLFLGHAKATRDFWVPRSRVQAQVRTALDRFALGYGGGLLVIGEPRSGRTSLLARIQGQQGVGTSIVVPPPSSASSDPALFDRHLGEGLGAAGSPEEALALLPSGSAVIVDDLDLWWERRPGGLDVVERILSLIDGFGSRLLFAVSVTPASVQLLRRLVPLEERFVASVHVDPFSADQLRDIVLVRHRSTGFDLEVEERPTGSLADWRMARFFNWLFQQTRGNVGDGLQAWIRAVESVEGNTIGVRAKEAPRLSALAELSSHQRTCLGAITLHRRVRPADLNRIVGLESADVEREIGVLKRCGMVVADGEALVVNSFVEPALRRDLEERGVI